MKRRLVVALLVLFAVWPAVQHLLVRRYDVDPWKLYAWGMYTVPGPMKTVRIVRIGRDGSAAVLAAYRPAEARAVDAFRLRRQALGRLASPAALADTVLELHPDWEGVAIPILSVRLDPKSGLTVAEVSQWSRWRDGSEADFEAPLALFDVLPLRRGPAGDPAPRDRGPRTE